MTDKLMGLHKHELVETARLFSGKGSKIDVVFHDGGACMGDGIIKLPNTAPMVALSEKGQRFDRAMVDHEAGHATISTMAPIQEHAGDNRMMSLINGIEDCRVEKYVTEKYAGSKKNLGTARCMVYEDMAEKIEASKDPRVFAGANINNAWWEKYGGWPSSNRQRAFEALPEILQDFCRRYADLAHALPSTKGSEDTVVLAEKALQELLDMGPTPQEPEPEADGDGDGEADGDGEQGEQEQEQGQGQGDAEGDGQGQGDEQGQVQVQGQGQDEDEDQGDEQGQEQGQEQEQGDGQGDGEGDEQGDGQGQDQGEGDEQGEDEFRADSECESADLAENHEAVRAKEGDDRTAKGYLGDAAFTAPMEIDVSKREVWKNIESMSPDCDTWKNMCAFFKLRSYTSKFFDQQWLNATARVKATVAPTQAKLQEAFMATSARNWAGGYDTGSLDPKALVRAYQGREGAFRRKDSGVDVNAAVTLLVDCSGSMDGTPMEVAGDMALALSMVLERMGVAVEVRGFTGDWGIYGGPVHADFVMKPFAKTVSQCRDGLGAMKYMASTANMDYVHVASASSSLMRREEEKKLLVVLSDGSTCGGHKELRELCRAIHCNLPIQLLGVGVMDTSVQSYYPDFVVVRNISDLSNVVAGRISQALMGRGLAGVKEAA